MISKKRLSRVRRQGAEALKEVQGDARKGVEASEGGARSIVE